MELRTAFHIILGAVPSNPGALLFLQGGRGCYLFLNSFLIAATVAAAAIIPVQAMEIIIVGLL